MIFYDDGKVVEPDQKTVGGEGGGMEREGWVEGRGHCTNGKLQN